MKASASIHLTSAQYGGLFRSLTLATILAVILLIAFGGVVRATGSGLGCPDWPLCHGQVIPPAQREVLIEYFHRLIASVVGLMVLVVAAMSWRFYRKERWIIVPAAISVLVLIVQVVLGGVTVLTELTPTVVMAHLAAAEILLACMILIYMVATYGPPSKEKTDKARSSGQFSVWLVLTTVFLFILLMTGSYVVGADADDACGSSWPLCQGQLLPTTGDASIQMFHRLIALMAGVLVAWTVFKAWKSRSERPLVAKAGLVLGGVFIAQAFIGAANIWLHLHAVHAVFEVLHLTTASIVWAVAVTLVMLSYIPKRQLRQGFDHA